MPGIVIHTEERVIRQVHKALKALDGMTGLNVSTIDAFNILTVENNLKSILDRNGYNVTYVLGKGTTIKKKR